MSDHDGGPAFPIVGEGAGDPRYHIEGLTKRDYFAAKAMAAFIVMWKPKTLDMMEDISDDSYHIADAMLRAREAKP